MKKHLLATFGLALGFLTFAQTPPQQVDAAFAKKFPNATKVKWEQEAENEWEAEFQYGGMETSACFDNSGTWLETETAIKRKDVPQAVLKAIEAEYKDWKIEAAEKIEKPDFSGYEIALEKNEYELEVLFSASGVIHQTKEKSSDEEEDD